jgi:hypothetical protein
MTRKDLQGRPAGYAVSEVGAERMDEAAALLAAAFQEYPFTHYLFDGDGPRYMEVMTAAYRMDCTWKLATGDPFLGVLADEKLVAVAMVAGAQPPARDERLEEMAEQLNRSFGAQTYARLSEYDALLETRQPVQPHMYLEDIGVLPGQRGKGLAGLLLRHINSLSEQNPLSTGVGLDTQVPALVDLYRHFGYQVTSEAQIGPHPIWFMFRPNSAPPGGE